jgi:hypothetical protein
MYMIMYTVLGSSTGPEKSETYVMRVSIIMLTYGKGYHAWAVAINQDGIS